MTLQDLGALGELIGALAVVLSLFYVAYQIRQNSRQIEHNSKHLESTMYYSTNDAFTRWWGYVAEDETLADLWAQVLAGEDRLTPGQERRFLAWISILFQCYENNFVQQQIGTFERDSLRLSRANLAGMLSQPVIGRWWQREAPHFLMPAFRAEVDRLVAEYRDEQAQDRSRSSSQKLPSEPTA